MTIGNDFLYLKKLSTPEVTTSMLEGMLSGYKNPQKKIHDLCQKGLIQSIKQGVYLVSHELGLRPYSKEILANLIYGPSYISLQTALSSYNMIPERVSSTTSVCFDRGKAFSTPVGEFEYHHIKKTLYPLGVQLKQVYDGAFCQIATPEKALLDFVYLCISKGEFKNSQDFFSYVLDSYRLDLSAIENQVSIKKLKNFADHYPFQHVQWFASELKRKLIK